MQSRASFHYIRAWSEVGEGQALADLGVFQQELWTAWVRLGLGAPGGFP